MELEYIYPLSDMRATLDTVGGKGASLARLARAGMPVPDGFYITTAAYRHFVAVNGLQAGILSALELVELTRPATLEAASNTIRAQFDRAQIPPEVAGNIAQAYAELAGRNPLVAVRSSATAEDLPEASFAGQQETFLNIDGYEEVLGAVKRCWASLWTARAIGYRMHKGIGPDGLSLAVVVQTLVPAEAAGILFTANPVTGRHDQAMISAAWGLGEAVVGGLVTPDVLVLEKASGKVLERQIADKQVMTARVNGGTQEQPVPAELRRTPVLDDESAAELVGLGVLIEQLFGLPTDIEWAIADGAFAILQARPITALPEAKHVLESEPPILLEWSLPDPKGQYMRASICELMPDPLSPLFITLGLPAIETGINKMAIDLLNMPPDTFAGFMLAINGYAYEKVTFTRSQWWMIISRMIPRVPYMLKAGVPYWQDVAHPNYAQSVERWKGQSLGDLPADEIWGGVQEIMAAFAQHLGALMGSTMGPTAGSEGLFTQVYEKLVMRPGDPLAPDFLMGFDSLPIKAEKVLYDLAEWCQGHVELANYLTTTPAGHIAVQIDVSFPPHGVSEEMWNEFQDRFCRHLDDFGYSIYDMDFAKPLPIDNPEPILEALKLFITGQGKDPYQRQQTYVEQREAALSAVRLRLKRFRRWAFEKSLKWAQSQAPLREDGITEIGLGYPVLRRMLLELGRRLVGVGAIQKDEDIFWLEAGEVEMGLPAFERGEVLEDYSRHVHERKVLWQAQKRLTPPGQLPIGKKYLGVNMEGILAVGDGSQEGHLIKGVPASPGMVVGIARVLHGSDDFDQMQPGDVLVASITTPAWTPLFSMASAIVTDIGGPLSHGSIVAREYGIPAVLGTGVATKRIRSGQTITVDGTQGAVILHRDDHENQPA